jgi:hypothetical protein
MIGVGASVVASDEFPERHASLPGRGFHALSFNVGNNVKAMG